MVASRKQAWLAAGVLALLGGCAPPSRPMAEQGQQVRWRFDRLDRIAGLEAHIEGAPRLVATRAGRAVAFDGIDDALYLPQHPLAAAQHFTAEAIFRPDGGAFEQRWLHLAEAPGGPGPKFDRAPPNGTRMLFEIRVVQDRWYLDAFVVGPGFRMTLMVPEKSFPVGRWYHVAQTYDGRHYRSYVDGVLQAEAEIAWKPQGAGYASLGTRINRRSYFHGAIYAARFTARALPPSEFMAVPRALR